MRYRDIISEATEPGEYVYHASYLPDLAKGLGSVAKHGLRPNPGMHGTGVYFAYRPEEGLYHVSAEDATMFRVRWQALVDLYGTYPDNPEGIQRDDEEIIVPGPVPAHLLEVEYFEDEWWTIDDALAHEGDHL